MGQLVKQHKTIPITWASHVVPLANFTVALVWTNTEKCGMQFVIEKFAPPSYETTQQGMYKILKKGQPLVNPEASGDQHSKYHHHVMSGIIPGDDTFHRH